MDEKIKEKMNNLSKAIDEFDGIPIPFNIIQQQIVPLRKWIELEFEKDEFLNKENKE